MDMVASEQAAPRPVRCQIARTRAMENDALGASIPCVGLDVHRVSIDVAPADAVRSGVARHAGKIGCGQAAFLAARRRWLPCVAVHSCSMASFTRSATRRASDSLLNRTSIQFDEAPRLG